MDIWDFQAKAMARIKAAKPPKEDYEEYWRRRLDASRYFSSKPNPPPQLYKGMALPPDMIFNPSPKMLDGNRVFPKAPITRGPIDDPPIIPKGILDDPYYGS